MSEQQPEPTDDDIIESDETTNVVEDAIETHSENLEATDEADSVLQTSTSDEMDIDAALAAVSQLTLLTQDEPDEDLVDDDYQPLPEDSITEDIIEPDPQLEFGFEFEQPRDLSMSRGQLASVIPALTLIILGGWFTLILTTSDIPPTAGLLFSVSLIAIGAIFLSQWLTSARWSRGNFFFGSSSLLIGGIQLYVTQASPATVNNGWSLWIIALGIALLGAGYIAVPRLPRLVIMGLLTIIAGGIGYILTSGVIDPSVIKFVSNLWFVGVVILVFMIVAPLIRRRQ
jgi:hypothetical protein